MSDALEKFKAKARSIRPDAYRVLSLPEKDYATAPDHTDQLKVDGGFWELLDPQNALLLEAVRCGGAIGSIGVGHGKTLISLLLPRVMEAKRPLLLIPAPMRKQLGKMAVEYTDQFDIATDLEVLSYHELSHLEPGQPSPLEAYRPDLIICDEVHKLANPTAARTGRLIRYFQQNPATRFVGMTGTLSKGSIHDFAHLVELALRGQSPLPLTYTERQSWGRCIDVHNPHSMPDAVDWERVEPLVEAYGDLDGTPFMSLSYSARKDAARDAFFKRFSSSPGVVHTITSSCNAPIYMESVDDLPIPQAVQAAIDEMESTWLLPGGEEIDNPMELARYHKQLLMGFYYRWVWPDDIVDKEWLYLRSEYRKQVRRWCARSTPGQDSPMLVERALESGHLDYPPLLEAWRQWQTVSDRPQPPTETVWLSDYLLEDAIERARSASEPCIVWYKHRAVAARLEDLGFDVMQPTDNPEHLTEAKDVALSMASHGTGKELQKWHRQIVLCPSSSGELWEQLLGRTHRQGQESDEVWMHVYQHHAALRESMEKAKQKSHAMERQLGQRQKLKSFTNEV